MDSLQLLIMVLALSADPGSSTAQAGTSLAQRAARTPPAVARSTGADVAFGTRERLTIQDYYRSNPRPSVRTAAARIERKRRLSPVLETQPLPASLARLLPILPPGYQRVVVGQDIALVEVATGTVVDVIRI